MSLLNLLGKSLGEGFNQFNRGIYETIIPPVDAYWIDGNIQVKADLGGFDRKDVEVELNDNILFIKAERDPIDEVLEKKNKDISIIYAHRPLKIRAYIPLPFLPNEDHDKKQPAILEKSVFLVNGVLTLDIVNLPKKSRHKPK